MNDLASHIIEKLGIPHIRNPGLYDAYVADMREYWRQYSERARKIAQKNKEKG